MCFLLHCGESQLEPRMFYLLEESEVSLFESETALLLLAKTSSRSLFSVGNHAKPFEDANRDEIKPV